MKRVLFINGGGVGGAEVITILYATILNEAGFDVQIITHKDCEANSSTNSIIPENIKNYEVKCKFRYFFFHVLKMIRLFKPDIIFCWNIYVVKHILIPIRKFHIAPFFKLVCRCPNTPSLMDAIESRGLSTFKQADLVIAQTKEMESELHSIIGINNNKLITVYNPIFKERIHYNIKEKIKLDHNFINYVATGRISIQKDYETLLRAFALVLKKQPNSRLYIIGRKDEHLMPRLLQIILNYRMTNCVFFEGYQSNPHKYEVQADAFVLSSIYEGLPNALLEAMYLGIPVAATTCIPFISQVIQNGINGYTCPIKNDKALSEAMIAASTLQNLPKFVDINNSEKQIIELFTNL